MAHSERLRQKKEKRRRDRLRVAREAQRRHRINVERYPQFIIEPPAEHVPSGFVEAVAKAVPTIRFNDRNLFPENYAQAYSLIKQVGFRLAWQLICDGMDEPNQVRLLKELMMRPGDILYAKLRERGVLNQYLPFCDVQLAPAQDVHVQFDAMLRDKGPHGTIYYARHRPTIMLEGRQYVVGYSRHAMERVAERATIDPRAYDGAGDAFSYLASQSNFRIVLLASEGEPQLAAELYAQCMPGFITASYAEQITGAAAASVSRLQYRLGYALMSCTGPYAVAVTFLAPGMRGTPEHQAVMKSGLSAVERRDMQARLERSFTRAGIHQHNDFSALRWLHEHGVPQVIERDADTVCVETERSHKEKALFATARINV